MLQCRDSKSQAFSGKVASCDGGRDTHDADRDGGVDAVNYAGDFRGASRCNDVRCDVGVYANGGDAGEMLPSVGCGAGIPGSSVGCEHALLGGDDRAPSGAGQWPVRGGR